MSPQFLAAMVLSVLVASAAAEEEGRSCADSSRCAVASDHSLLQAKVNVHQANISMLDKSLREVLGESLGESRDCAEFGVCKTDEKGRQARLARLEERLNNPSPLYPGKTLVAWDCGSSGSTMKITAAGDACVQALKKLGYDPLATVSEEAKGDPVCSVSQAFSGPGGNPVGGCAGKWNSLAAWAQNPAIAVCFRANAVCWGAGTAGNRLVSKEQDLLGWKNFAAWATTNFCSQFVAGKYVSYQIGREATMTIPGTMEAAMEVETIYAKGIDNNVIAFGSAGGSSGQFGVCLSCSPKGLVAAQKAWNLFVQQHSLTFQQANYHSPVDTLPEDYLNTYTRTGRRGGVWGVGSFLGSDKCDGTTLPADSTQLLTPMGGISAMKCGYGQTVTNKGIVVTNPDIDKASATDIESAMAGSDQGKFAQAFAQFMITNYAGAIEKKGAVMFVAKISTSLGKVGKLKTAHMDGPFVKVGYAFMKTLGLLPSAWGKKTSQEEEDFLLKNYQREDWKEEYAWLETAADIGFGTLPAGSFAKPVTSVESTRQVNAYMNPTASSTAKIVLK